MCQFHKPVDEKRMVVVLPPDSYDPWLKATTDQSMAFMRQQGCWHRPILLTWNDSRIFHDVKNNYKNSL
jgi:hypothetical protein